MKVSKVLAALVSAVTFTSTAGMTSFAEGNKNITTDSEYNYVALGDSIAAGFGLAGGDLTQDPALIITDELLANPVKGAYPAVFTEYISKLGEEKGYDVKGTNLASTAYRAADIEKTIKTPGYKGEFASGILESYLGEGSSDVLKPYHDIYTNYLSEADLVSIQLGGNDIIMSIVPQMVYSENPVLQAAGMSLMLTLFGTDSQTAIGGGLQILAEKKDSISSDDFIEAATFMYNVAERADELVDESASHVRSVVEAVQDLNGDADIALVGMFNPYRTEEEAEDVEAEIMEVLGKIYNAAANTAAESENELTPNGKQTADYIEKLSNKVTQINEINDIMEKYNDTDELQDILNMISEYDDINEVKDLAKLLSESEGSPEKLELMALILKYDDIGELQSAIDLIRDYDDLSELTELMAVMAKYRTSSQAAAENAIASEVIAPMAMQIAGKNVDPQMRRLNENLMNVAEETGAVYVDVYGISPEDDFDPHPNANGHKEIAGILYDTLSDLISDRMKPVEIVTTTTTSAVTTQPETTTTTTAVTTEESSTVTTEPLTVKLWGDANDDGVVNMADAVLIMQSISNPDAYQLTPQGSVNADVYQNGSGITGQDAVTIQKYLLQLIDTLPVE